ncbi:hypothetical protein [Pedobacter mucosus]|uniref:hypothetical protein n=1 Tax=Pedobacter mucosus TaxID=2895286 RepID=UPI001EE4CD9C|nr:hypothetical protein [Pedobacter mucosus]UKT63333.1 hypothetical protein LOK61_16370 [Pedobacter mucosus]
MIERIVKDSIVFAIIIRSEYKSEGIEFFTPTEFSQQLGYMNRKKGYVINAHKHRDSEVTISKLFETLVVKSGSTLVSFFDENDLYFQDTTINKGDVILFTGYGHQFEMLEDTEIIEVKQGPYLDDKVYISTPIKKPIL